MPLPEPPAPAPVPHDAPLMLGFALTAARCEEIARLLRGADGDRLASHLLVLRACFPERDAAGDRALDAALGDARAALCDVFDRLYVKLRIPGFDVTASDCDDAGLRDALRTLVARMADARGGGDGYELAAARVTRDTVPSLRDALALAPFGAPSMLRALVALVPRVCDDDPLAGAAIARYATALDAVLARHDDDALAAFEDALNAPDAALDDARATLLAALRARTLAGVA